jgi:hypothetical protein
MLIATTDCTINHNFRDCHFHYRGSDVTHYTTFTNYMPEQDQQSLFETPKVAVSSTGCILDCILLLYKPSTCNRIVSFATNFILSILHVSSLRHFLLMKYFQLSYVKINLMILNCIYILTET